MKCVLATSLRARLIGLLKASCCSNGEVLMLAPCKSIHTFGMRSYLDIAFLDASACIVASERNVPPARIRTFRQAVAVLERRSNPQLDWPREGERIEVAFKERIRKEGIR